MEYRGKNADPFDPFCRNLIREQARRIVHAARLPDHEVEDVVQDLRLHAWERSRYFDPDKGTWSTFARTLIERKAATLLQRSRAECRDRGAEAYSLDELDFDSGRRRGSDTPAPCDAVAGTRDPRREVAIDVRRAVRRLAPRDRALAQALMVDRVAEVSAATGVPRSTLYVRIARIRDQLRDAGIDGNRRAHPTVSGSAQ